MASGLLLLTEHEREEPVVCANVSQVSALPPGSHLNDDEANRQQHELITDVIKPVVAHSTGDKGNPYYAAELNRHEPGTLLLNYK